MRVLLSPHSRYANGIFRLARKKPVAPSAKGTIVKCFRFTFTLLTCREHAREVPHGPFV